MAAMRFARIPAACFVTFGLTLREPRVRALWRKETAEHCSTALRTGRLTLPGIECSIDVGDRRLVKLSDIAPEPVRPGVAFPSVGSRDLLEGR